MQEKEILNNTTPEVKERKRFTKQDLEKAELNQKARIQRSVDLMNRKIEKTNQDETLSAEDKQKVIVAAKEAQKETVKKANLEYKEKVKEYKLSLKQDKVDLKEAKKERKNNLKNLKDEYKNELKNNKQEYNQTNNKFDYQVKNYDSHVLYQQKVKEENNKFIEKRNLLQPDYDPISKIITKGIIKENPVFITLLGLCPALAVTNSVEKAIGMGLLFLIIVMITNIIVSLIRKVTPNSVRIPIFIIIIATTVTAMELLMKAYLPALSSSLGNFIALITVNCIVLGRAEAYASKNNPFKSLLDGLGIGLGFTLALLLVGFSRELIGSGQLVFGEVLTFLPKAKLTIIPEKIAINTFLLPAGSFLVIGLLLALFNYIKSKKENISNLFTKKDPRLTQKEDK